MPSGGNQSLMGKVYSMFWSDTGKKEDRTNLQDGNAGELSQQINCIFLGHGSPGKTSVLNRWVNNRYVPYISSYSITTGVDFSMKEVKYSGQRYKTVACDSSSSKIFYDAIKNHVKGKDFCIICVTDNTSAELNRWLSFVNENSPGAKIVVLLTKTDACDNLEKVFANLREQAKEYNVVFHQCSAKEGTGVDELFNKIIPALYEGEELEDSVGNAQNFNW